jgi:hypothetical protein
MLSSTHMFLPMQHLGVMIPPTQVHMIPLKDLLISRQRLLALSQGQKRLRPLAKFRNIRRLRIQADHDFPITLLRQ